MADSKISTLTNYTTPASTDVLVIVDIGGGTVTKKITWGNLFTSPTLITPALGTPVSGVMTNVTGLPTAGLVNNAVTNAKAAQMATKTYKGRTSALTGDAEDVAVATLKTDLVLVKGDVGLGSVDNTTDAGKPVSTAQQTALDLKANLASPTFTGTVVLPNSQALVTPVLGTPTSVTLTNATGLPIAGLVNSTSAALGLGTIELGHATDTTIARSSAGVATIEGVRIDTVATTTEVSNATPAPAITATRHTHTITALAAAATFGVPTSSIALTDDNILLIRIKDNATARALVWNAIFRASSDLALPSTTVVSKTLYLGFKYNVADTKWDLLSLLNNI